VRLSLVSEAAGGATAAWADPVIDVPALQAARPAQPVKNVIVWLVDTLRWDRLKAYNEKTRVKTPNFDDFLAKGTMFSHFTVQGAHSIPSHASMLTALYPTGHGHHHDTTKLKPSIRFVSEQLKAAGIKTAMISSNGYVSTKWGFEQGWDYYKNFIRDSEPAAAWNLYKEVETWLKGNHKQRFFLNIITIDMHVAYRWRDDYCKQYDPEPYSGPVKDAISGNFLNKITTGKVTLSERDKKRMIATYDCNGTYNDEYFGKMLALLDQLGIRNDTLVLVVSDHGDEFWDHGGVGHGHSLHDELVRVPFFLNLPAVVPEGKRVDTNVELVDVAPTILDFMGVEPMKGVAGESLVPLIYAQGPLTPRPGFSEHYEVARSMAVEDWKYILKHGDNAQLFDIAKDPYEQKDLRANFPLVDRFARDVLAFWVSYDGRWQKTRWGLPNNHSAAFAEEAWK
jgi:arylsulfatase A-like enzyme